MYQIELNYSLVNQIQRTFVLAMYRALLLCIVYIRSKYRSLHHIKIMLGFILMINKGSQVFINQPFSIHNESTASVNKNKIRNRNRYVIPISTIQPIVSSEIKTIHHLAIQQCWLHSSSAYTSSRTDNNSNCILQWASKETRPSFTNNYGWIYPPIYSYE